jgi:hypothetical protein
MCVPRSQLLFGFRAGSQPGRGGSGRGPDRALFLQSKLAASGPKIGASLKLLVRKRGNGSTESFASRMTQEAADPPPFPAKELSFDVEAALARSRLVEEHVAVKT